MWSFAPASDDLSFHEAIGLLSTYWGGNPEHWHPSQTYPYKARGDPNQWPDGVPSALARLAQVAGSSRRSAALATLETVIRERVIKAARAAQDKEAQLASTKGKRPGRKRKGNATTTTSSSNAADAGRSDDDQHDDAHENNPKHALVSDIRTAAARMSYLNEDASYPRSSNSSRNAIFSTSTPSLPAVVDKSNNERDMFNDTSTPEIPPTTARRSAAYPVATRPARRLRSAIGAFHDASLVDFDAEEYEREARVLRRKRASEDEEIDYRFWGKSAVDPTYGPAPPRRLSSRDAEGAGGGGETGGKRKGEANSANIQQRKRPRYRPERPMPSPPPHSPTRPGGPGTMEWRDEVERLRAEKRKEMEARTGGGGVGAALAKIQAFERITADLNAEIKRLKEEKERKSLQKRIRELEAEVRRLKEEIKERDRKDKETEEAAQKEEREKVRKALAELGENDMVMSDG
ncbi:hypothetical protein MPH_12862 [Macrophomina phaseolina MS6]|uniref:Uncharacterized protein n=1 Tax=Macrophomina phaseolina (strain MS6) TaxID=1126212 RepID=K2R741_MACPH|nr:hypothetical protein MPH_12862 [Macrophomina phaseolina MS6]